MSVPSVVENTIGLNGTSRDTRRKHTTISLFVVTLIILSWLVISASMQSVAEAKVIKVACVGDSITEHSGYPLKLQLLLGTHYKVENFGVSGSTVSINSNISYMNQNAFQKALDFQPDIVLVMLGTNDANLATANDTDLSDDYIRLVTSFQNLNSSPEILLVDSPHIYSTYSGYNNTYLTTNVIPTINNVADQMNLSTVDIYDTMNSPSYFADGIHPNDDGATILASTMYDALQQYIDQTG
jgi:lysophospholipase L1-like esterase